MGLRVLLLPFPPSPSTHPTTCTAENITSRVFGGTLRSDLICSSCGHVSTSHEHFSHLSLDIPPPQSVRGWVGGRDEQQEEEEGGCRLHGAWPRL